jgi:hypothetical protein
MVPPGTLRSRSNPVANLGRPGHPGRMTPDEQDSLLRPVPPTGSWRDAALVGGKQENDELLAEGFLAAADILAEHWKTAPRPNDKLALPILSNYRHAIELALKATIRSAAKCLLRDGHQDKDLERQTLDRLLSSTHSIGALVEKLEATLDRLNLGPGQRLPADTHRVLHSLHALDESGQTLRYSTVKVGRGGKRTLVAARPDETEFDLTAVADALHEACSIVLFGVSGVVSEYEDYQRDMLDGYSDLDHY